MLTDTLKTRRHLTDDLDIPAHIADGIIETVTSAEDQVATKIDLQREIKQLEAHIDKKSARWALAIVLGNAAMVAALLALYGFAA